MVNCLDEITDRLDIYRTPAFITFKKKWFISSHISKICSTLFLTFVIYSIFHHMKQFIKFENFHVDEIQKDLPLNTEFILNKTNTMFAFKFTNQKLQQNFQKYFRAEYINFNLETIDFKIKENENMQFEQCQLHHFHNLNQSEFQGLNLQDFLCIQVNFTSKLQNLQTNDFGAFIKLRYCYFNETDCIDLSNPQNLQQFQDDYEDSQSIIVRYLNNDFFYSNYDQPVQQKISYNILYLSLNSKQYQVIRYFFQHFLLEQQNKIGFEKSNYIQGFFTNFAHNTYHSIMQQKLYNGSLIYKFDYLQSINSKCTIITYQTFIDIIIQINGKVLLLGLILSELAAFANRNYFKQKIAQKICGIKLKTGFIQFLTGYSIQNTLTNQQQQQLGKYLDSSRIFKNQIQYKILKNVFFSKYSHTLLNIMQKQPKNKESMYNISFTKHKNKFKFSQSSENDKNTHHIQNREKKNLKDKYQAQNLNNQEKHKKEDVQADYIDVVATDEIITKQFLFFKSFIQKFYQFDKTQPLKDIFDLMIQDHFFKFIIQKYNLNIDFNQRKKANQIFDQILNDTQNNS